jgi:drug/metabolite transporter (DMT)-like permease
VAQLALSLPALPGTPLTGIALKVAATVAFSLMTATVRYLGHFPTGELVFFRCFFSLVPLLVVALWTGGIVAAISTRRPGLHLARSMIGTFSMFFYFTAVTLLPLTDSTALSFVMPIFSVILAAVILKESVGLWRWGAVLIGFAGVLLMLEPHGGVVSLVAGGLSLGAAAGLTGSFFSAFVVIFIRQMSTTERSEAIVFYFMMTCSILGAITMVWDAQWPNGFEFVLLVLSGILGGIGQICMTYSYRYAEPSLLAPFDYIAIVWATILGFLIFHELPVIEVIIGSAIIIGSGIFITWREHRRRQEIERPQSL